MNSEIKMFWSAQQWHCVTVCGCVGVCVCVCTWKPRERSPRDHTFIQNAYTVNVVWKWITDISGSIKIQCLAPNPEPLLWTVHNTSRGLMLPSFMQQDFAVQQLTCIALDKRFPSVTWHMIWSGKSNNSLVFYLKAYFSLHRSNSRLFFIMYVDQILDSQCS